MIFSTTEIFEAILIQLSSQDLLRMQQVARHWNQVITQSHALQQKLFFRPISNKDARPELNPLLQTLFPPCFALKTVPTWWDLTAATGINEQNWFQDENRRMSVLRPEASWRRMLPVQPPARIDRISWIGNCGCSEYFNKGGISSQYEYLQADGARMGLIYDILVHYVEDWSGYFFIQWHMFPALPSDEAVVDTPIEDVEHNMSPLENKITIHGAHETDCFDGGPAERRGETIGLKVIEFNKSVIEISQKV